MIKGKTVWKENYNLVGESGDHSVELDTKRPLGKDSALTPKELVVIGLCGCTAMDVVAMLKKYKQPLEAFEVRAEVATTEKGYPQIFTNVEMVFDLKGKVDEKRIMEAVESSQTKYCGVSAMIAKSAPISYKVLLNGKEIGHGEAKF